MRESHRDRPSFWRLIVRHSAMSVELTQFGLGIDGKSNVVAYYPTEYQNFHRRYVRGVIGVPIGGEGVLSRRAMTCWCG
jgi:hypothetical protein